jgi:hypothetical protein
MLIFQICPIETEFELLIARALNMKTKILEEPGRINIKQPLKKYRAKDKERQIA